MRTKLTRPSPDWTSRRNQILALLALSLWPAATSFAAGTAAPAQDPAVQEKPDRPRGIRLGEFVVREYHPIRGDKSTASFTIVASVAAADRERFDNLLVHRRHKVRDQIITATRLIPVSDFDDPQLVNVRRRIRLRLGRTLPELAIQDLLVTDFNFTMGK